MARREGALSLARARSERTELCRIELEVVPWNTPAIALYEKLGFRLEAVKEKAIAIRGKPESLHLMARVW